MIDLKLNYNGDISFEQTEVNKNSININFVTSKTKALNVNFYIDNWNENMNSSEDSLTILFKTYNPANNKKCIEIVGNEYIEQAIRIRIETAINTIKGQPDLGSELDSIKHEYIDSNNINQKLIKILKEALKDILPNVEISIKRKSSPYLDYSSGLIAEFVYEHDNKYVYKF